MRVILLKDVPKVGKKYEVKNVADGFALHSLIPKQLAENASSANLKHYEHMRSKAEAERAVRHELLAKSLEDLDKKTVTFSVPANDEGHLYAGLHAADIQQAISEQCELTVPESSIELPEPIKTTGMHRVSVRVEGKAAAEITLSVSKKE